MAIGWLHVDPQSLFGSNPCVHTHGHKHINLRSHCEGFRKHLLNLWESYMISMMLLYVLLSVCASALVTIPQPAGLYGVSLVDYVFNDTTRTDPYTGKSYRLLPVTVVTPSGPISFCQPVLRPFMSNATAQYWGEVLSAQTKLPLQNIFSQVQLSLCSQHDLKTKSRYPLIFSSPGAEAPNEWYSILTTNLAAQGYVVVQVGVPGEISFLQFPDGHIEYGSLNQTDPVQLATAMNIRVKDISFVLDQLSSPEADLSCANANIETRSPSVFGHSLGGSTALAALIADHRFVAGANADGKFWGEAIFKPTDQPFMILASTPNYTKSLSTVPNWAEVWLHLHGPKWLISVENSVHRSFVNINLIAEYQGLFDFPELRQFLGDIDPHEMLSIQVALFSEMGKFSSGLRLHENITEIAEIFQQVDVLNSSLSGSG